MSAFNYYKEGFTKKFADFNGRARRSEYWYFVLFNALIAIAAMGVDMLHGMGPFLYGIYALAALIPGLAVLVRRLHDTGRSGWWLLVVLVPLLGAIALIVFLVTDSKPGTNQFGPNPKGIGSDQPADHLISDEV